MHWFMGLDASTQSLSAIVIDPENKRIVCELEVDFRQFPEYHCPNGFINDADPLVRHADPLLWVAALEFLLDRLGKEKIDLTKIRCISGSGQQHGTVYLKTDLTTDNGATTRLSLTEAVKARLSRPTAPIWMDSSTAEECSEISRLAGGASYVRQATGSPATERFAGPQIRKFWKTSPELYEQTVKIHLISSFMGSLLAGRDIPIDYGDGAGMNLMNLSCLNWDQRMLRATAPKLRDKLPPLTPSSTIVGNMSPRFQEQYGFSRHTRLLAWSGDNPNSLIGVGGHAPGVAVISLGTSHTYFSAMTGPTVDPAGYGHVFGNPAGGFMSLICFKNGALAQEAIRKEAGINWRQFEQCLRDTPAGNQGNLMLPYFVPEITPRVLSGTPRYRGTPAFENGQDKASRVRAVVEAQALRLRLHSGWIGECPGEIRVTGGASVNDQVCQVLADVFNARVQRLTSSNSAGLGAAMRAAQAAGAGNWTSLTRTFCRPIAGQQVEPRPENVEVYKKMLIDFAAFADAGP